MVNLEDFTLTWPDNACFLVTSSESFNASNDSIPSNTDKEIFDRIDIEDDKNISSVQFALTQAPK